MSAMNGTVRPALLSEFEEVLRLSAEAFADEAVLSWVLNKSTGVGDAIREFFAPSLAEAIAAGELILARTSEGEAMALSLWHILDGSPHGEAASETAEDSDPVSRRLHAVASATAARHPDQGHMFLSSMATHPTFRGQGAGAAMLDYGIEQAEAHELPVYLEASTPHNRRLYLRHGFADVGSPIRLPEDGPVLQPMWRRQPC